MGNRNKIVMNWYLTSQNNNLFNNIYKLLIGAYNNLGQSYYNDMLNDILSSMIDISTLDETISQASMSALQNLKISVLTPAMRNAVNDIILGFKSSAPRPEEFAPPIGENTMEGAVSDGMAVPEGQEAAE